MCDHLSVGTTSNILFDAMSTGNSTLDESAKRLRQGERLTNELQGSGSVIIIAIFTGNSTLDDIADSLRLITDKLRQGAEDERLTDEWKALGRVVDRLFFWIVCIVLIITTMVLLLQRDAEH